MNKKIPTVIAISIVLVAAILAGGFVYWKYFSFQKELSNQSDIVIPEKEAQDETANWQTYRNQEYSLEFKYPDDVVLTTKSEWPEITLMLPFPVNLDFNPCNVKDIYISVFNEKIEEIGTDMLNTPLKDIADKEEINTPNLKGYLLKGGSDYCVFHRYYFDFSGKTLYVQRNFLNIKEFREGYNFLVDKNISLEQYEEIQKFITSDKIDELFNQILSTLKFIGTDEIANWQTYINEQYGFKIKYPDSGDWQINEINDYVSLLSKAYRDFMDGIGGCEARGELSHCQYGIYIYKDTYPNDPYFIVGEYQPLVYLNAIQLRRATRIPTLEIGIPTGNQENDIIVFELFARYVTTGPQVGTPIAEDIETFEKIISTFNFLNTTSSDYKTVPLKDVIQYADINKVNYVKTTGTIVDLEYSDFSGSILLSDNTGNYILVVISHADMTSSNFYRNILSSLKKGDNIEVSGVVFSTVPSDWTSQFTDSIKKLPPKIGGIMVMGLIQKE